MHGVLEGFGVIAVVIGLGYVLARFGVLGAATQETLARLVFYVGAPALLFVTLSQADIGAVLSGGFVVTAASVAVTALSYVLVATFIRKRSGAETVIGALSSSYVNAGNLGIPVAVYVLGTASYIAPVMLLQLLVMAPIAFAVLDATAARNQASLLARISQPLRNPVTVATLLGVLVAVSGVDVPLVIGRPIELVAGLAVPAALIAYGVSLRGAPRVGSGGALPELVLIAVLKVIAQPVAAFLVARYALDLSAGEVFAGTVMAALPTAQNVFVYAVRYDRGVTLARESIFVTTMASAPTILIIAALLA